METTATESEETETESEETETESEGGYTGGTLRMASPGPIQTLDPVNAKGSGAGYNQYGESLLEFPNGQLPPKPRLATDFSISDDGLTYSFKLKEGVKFHDGSEMTGSDWVYSWERLAGSVRTRNADDIVGETFRIAHEGNTQESVTNYKPGTLAVEAPSKYEFRFTLVRPFANSLSQIAGGAFAVIPENAVLYPEDYEKHGMDEPLYEGQYKYNVYFSTEGDGPKFAGTGPFQVDSWSKGDQIRLAAFDDYHGTGPYIDAITYTVISSQSTIFKRFKNKNLDIVNGIPTAQFAPNRLSINNDYGSYKVGEYQLDTGDTVKYGEATALDTDYILFNCQRTPRPVRRAFAYLINQEVIAQDIYKGVPDSAYHITPPPVFMHKEGENAAEIYDRHYQEGYRNEIEFASDGWPYGIGETRIQDARQVMEDAGYGEDNQYSVEFTIFAGDPEWDQLAQVLRDKAVQAHINVDITKADFGTIISKAINGDMDMFSLGDGMEWPESDNFLRFLHPYQDPSFMFTRWTVNVSASGVDFRGDSEETVKNLVHARLPDSVQKRHVSASKGDDGTGTVTVFIEGITAERLGQAIDEAGYSYESLEGKKQPFTKFMELADEAWTQFYEPNTGPGQENQQKRNKAYYIIEECNWASVQELPTVHSVTQRLWQPRVDVQMVSTMEDQTFNTLRLTDQS